MPWEENASSMSSVVQEGRRETERERENAKERGDIR